MSGYLLGYDIGSSAIKASLVDVDTGMAVASAVSPRTEMEITAVRKGWAEQSPEMWWEHIVKATSEIRSETGSKADEIEAIGIAYQMHGLVAVDSVMRVVRPAIIWCDSRAVSIGRRAFEEIGKEKCLRRLLNSPGNFTASKVKWVMENEPEIYEKIHRIMLPGDYIAMRMTGEIRTSVQGLSEAVLWDFERREKAGFLMDYYGISSELIPDTVPAFSVQGELTGNAVKELGLKKGIKVCYRGGDQPNNALSLNVLSPGEIAATAGTSGVVYGVTDSLDYDKDSRVNTFVHVNHSPEAPRYGVLLCVNGAGILNSWLKETISGPENQLVDYHKMNSMASDIPAGSEGLLVIPYGNGAERTLGDSEPGASIHGLCFNTHGQAHLCRAVQEGIAFALNYGLEIMREAGTEVKIIRAGHANMFLSPVFAKALSTVSGADIELYDTDGARGAATGAGIGSGIYRDAGDAFRKFVPLVTVQPDMDTRENYLEAYGRWRHALACESDRLQQIRGSSSP